MSSPANSPGGTKLPPSSSRRKYPLSPSSRKYPLKTTPPSPKTQGRLYAKLSSIVEGSFYDGVNIKGNNTVSSLRGKTSSIRSRREERTNLTHLAPSQSFTDSVHLQDKTKDEVDRNIVSFVVVYTMIFFNGCCFTAVVPSVPFYLEVLGAPPSFLGLVVSFYSVGQLIGSPIAGWLNDHFNSRSLLTLSSLVGLAASTFYACALNQWFVLLSRILTGISAGMEFTTELAFIARHTTTEERTTFLASVTAVNVLGFIMGPALTTVLALVKFTVMGFEVNEYTGPGWLLVMMFIVDFLMIRLLYEDSYLADEEAKNGDTQTMALVEEEENNEGVPSYGAISSEEGIDNMENGSSKPEPGEGEPDPPSVTLVLSLIFTQFTVMCAWSVLETITSPLAADSFGWSVQECNILFTCGGVASLAAYVSFVIASKWIEDRWLIVYALVACFFGLLLMIHWAVPFAPPYKYCFLVGYLIMNAGFMTGRPVTFALYSKLVPSEFQGKYLGWMVAGGSAARTFGPFVAVYLYYHIGGPWKNTLALFGSEGVIMVVCLVLLIALWSSLLPAKPNVQKASSEHKKLLNKYGISSHSSSPSGDISMHVDGEKLAQ